MITLTARVNASDETARLFVSVAPPDPTWPAAKTRAYERGIEHTKRLLEETGGSLSLRQVTERLGISRHAVARMVRRRLIFSVPGPFGRRRYPAIQFDPNGGVVSGLREISAAFEGCSPYFLLWFLANANDLCGDEKVIELLRAGNLDRVIRAANIFFEQGA